MADDETFGGSDDDETDESEGARARNRARSPNYPALTFTAALERTEKIYKKEKRSPVSIDVAVRHLGYSKENGATFQLFGALKRYGLLVSTGKGRDVRVSDDAHFIFVHPEGHPDRIARMRKLAMSPPLFGKILAAFGGELPSDENLIAKLQTDEWGFKSEVAAKTVVRSLRDAVHICGDGVAEEGSSGDTNGESIKEFAVTPPQPPAINQTLRSPAPAGVPALPVVPLPTIPGRSVHDPESVIRRWEIAEGRFASVALPPDPTVEDVTIVEEFLGILKQELALVWKRKARANAQQETP